MELDQIETKPPTNNKDLININSNNWVQSQESKKEHPITTQSLKENELNMRFKEELAAIKYLTQKCDVGFGLGGGLDLSLVNLQESRPSLINAFSGNIKLSYGPPTTLVIAPPSSGIEEKNYPSFKEVVEILVEASYIQYTSKIEEIPLGIKPSIFITNIEQSTTAKQVKMMIDHYTQDKNNQQTQNEITQNALIRKYNIDHIKLMNYIVPGSYTNKIANIELRSKDQAISLFKYLSEIQSTFFNNSHNLMKVYYSYDKRKVKEENWVGVVLRNLPPDCSSEMMKKNFSNTEKVKILTADTPVMIKGQKCAIVRVENIEQAELFCKKWNNFSFNQTKKLKAHIHPMSSTRRVDQSKSVHQFISRQAQKHQKQTSLFNQVILPPFGTEKTNRAPTIEQRNGKSALENLMKSLQNIADNTQQQSTGLGASAVVENAQPFQTTNQTQINKQNPEIPKKSAQSQSASDTVTVVSSMEEIKSSKQPMSQVRNPQSQESQQKALPIQQQIQPKEVCLQKCSQEYEIEQRSRVPQIQPQLPLPIQIEQKDQKSELSVNNELSTSDNINNLNTKSNSSTKAQVSQPISNFSGILNQNGGLEPLPKGDRLPQKKPEQISQKQLDNDFLDNILNGNNHKLQQRKVSLKQDSSKQPDNLLKLNNTNGAKVAKPEDLTNSVEKPKVQQANSTEIQGFDTKESSEDKILGKRKQEVSKDQQKFEDKVIQRGRKKNRIVESSDEDSDDSSNSSSDNDDYEDEKSNESSNIKEKGKKLKRRNQLGSESDEDEYDPSKIDKKQSNQNTETRKRGRPKKQKRVRGGRRGSRQSSLSNSTTNLQQALVQSNKSNIDSQQYGKRARGRPPKKQSTEQGGVFDFNGGLPSQS